MATVAQVAPPTTRPSTWFLQFLREELTPYPGRTALVARMMIAATLAMLISMTFRRTRRSIRCDLRPDSIAGEPASDRGRLETVALAFAIAAGLRTSLEH